MNDHRHNSATEDGGDDGEEDTIVSMEVIRGDWVKVRTARENQLQSLSHDQLKKIANFCAPEQLRSHSNAPHGTSSSNDYKVIIMEVLDYALLGSIDVEKSKKKRSKSLDHFKNCLDYIDQVRKNRQSATTTAYATTTNTDGSTRRDIFPPEVASASTATATNNPEDYYFDMDNVDLFTCIASEDGINPLVETARTIPPQPNFNTAFNTATESRNNPTIQNKERSSNPQNMGTSNRTISATAASSTAALNTTNNNFVSQSQHSMSSPSSSPAAIKPPSGVSSTKDVSSLTSKPSFTSMLQKSAVTTSTALNPYMSSSKTTSKNSPISNSSSISTTLASTPSTTLATSITGTNNGSPNSLPVNTNGNTGNHTNDNSMDRTSNRNISAGTKVQNFQSSDMPVHSPMTQMNTTTTTAPSFPSATVSTEPSADFTSARVVNGKLNDPLNEKPSERCPGNEKATSSNEMNIMIGNNKGNNINNYTAKDGPALPLVFDSKKHISYLYHISPGSRTENLCTFDIGASLEPYAASLYTRRACRVQYPVPKFPSLSMMHKNGTINVRFNRWDPFYKCKHDIVNFVRDKTTNQILKVQYRDTMGVEQFPVIVTSSIVNCTPLDGRGRPTTGAIDANVKPMACLEVNFQFPSDIANLVKSWGFESLGKTDNDTNRLICRMLPLDSKAMKTDFADTHLWPKGTYMEVNGKPVVLQQRRQQSHDPSQWKGMCKQLDLTSYVTIPISMNRIKLVAQENACYALQICIAEQRTPLTVFNEVLKSIPVIPMAAALERGKQYVDNQTICLEHDNISVSGGRHNQEGGAPGQQKKSETKADSYHLTFKLVCPISMTVMNEPVRGQQCQHFQCFDLFNFIETNSFPSGRRWKCPCCDSFVSLDSLELCGWFKEILNIHGSKVSADGIDSVKMFPNGQWELVSSSANSNKRKVDILPQQQMKRNKVALEVIEIDLD